MADPSVAALAEVAGAECVCDAGLRASWSGARLLGPAFPVAGVGGDNLVLHHAVAAAAPGDVLVVDAQGAPAGHWGEILAVAAHTRGLRGLVIDGAVRDIDALARRRFPVFARGISPRGTGKRHPGRLGEPVTAGGVRVSRGDIVVGDSDGVVVVPAAHALCAIERARAREAHERELIAKLEAGATTLELYDLPQRADRRSGMSRVASRERS